MLQEVRGELLIQAPAMTAQENRYVVPRLNDLESNMTSRLIEFVRMNLPTLLVSKVGEDLQAFLDEI